LDKRRNSLNGKKSLLTRDAKSKARRAKIAPFLFAELRKEHSPRKPSSLVTLMLRNLRFVRELQEGDPPNLPARATLVKDVELLLGELNASEPPR
jgi:hypothetical protein